MKCFIAFFARDGRVKWKDGQPLELKQHDCNKNWTCLDVFPDCLFGETIRTEQGLLSKPNQEGKKLFPGWLKKNCPHPQKKRIIKFLEKQPPRPVLIGGGRS